MSNYCKCLKVNTQSKRVPIFGCRNLIAIAQKAQSERLFNTPGSIQKKYFNVGFGDKNSITNDMDDLVVTNNNDSQKVLTAVAA